jgi:hypothetical protein
MNAQQFYEAWKTGKLPNHTHEQVMAEIKKLNEASVSKQKPNKKGK